VRSEAEISFRDELRRRVRDDHGLDVSVQYTRKAPDDSARPPRRIDAADLAALGWPADLEPTCYVCGSTPFVEAVADLLVAVGHDAVRIRTERYGG
jgi:ferredoxin-NADP reductase